MARGAPSLHTRTPMKIRLFLLASCLLALAPLAADAQVTVLTDSVTAFGHQRPAVEIPVTAPAPATEFASGLGELDATYGFVSGVALDLLARQPLSVTPVSTSEAKLGLVARFALDQELASGAFRPFVGVNLGRLYGDAAREDWAAGVAAGARYFVQPRTFVRASAEYGWMFSHARGFNDRFAEGQWTWSMGLGFTF
ncbi:MAG: hypothetical protein C0518_13295 [Opitutus sp.]|nr:hypothetical protein [Opitutus sp.]